MLVALDVDGVVADLHQTWLDQYNADWNDSLTPADITQWDVSKVVKPECGERIYEYLHNPALYDSVQPIPGALAGVQELRALGHRVVFVTAANARQSGPKVEWLGRHGFVELKHHCSPDIVVASDKSLIRADVLVDDYQKNLEGFTGKRVLFDQPHNAGASDQFLLDNRCVRVGGWLACVFAIRIMGKPKEPETILQEAQRICYGDRHADYGEPFFDYQRTVEAFNSLTGHKLTVPQGAIFMLCVKLSRLAHRYKRDSAVDVAGYADVLDRIERWMSANVMSR